MNQKSNNATKVITTIVLFTLSALLTSCQKKEIQSHGMFTNYTIKAPKRSIASVKGISFHFSPKNLNSFQDTKQIYIYCSLKSEAPKKCYDKHFETTMTLYKEKFGPFKDNEIALLKDNHDFEHAKNNIETLSAHVIKTLEPKLNHLVNQRVSFCKKNSKYYLKRCLNQYIEKDSFHVLNAYQKSHPSINGPEYLYLKKKISKAFSTHLEQSYQKIKLL